MKRFAVGLVAAIALSGCLSEVFDREPTYTVHAHALLWSTHADILVQVHHVAGREPSQYALDRLEEEIIEHTGKPVTIQPSQQIAVGDETSDRSWTVDEVWGVHAQHYMLDDPNAFTVDDTAIIHVVYLNGLGESTPGRNFIGLHTGPVLFVLPDSTTTALLSIYADPLVIGPPNLLAQEQAEAAILVHELGHALGLVGLEAPETANRITGETDDPCTCHSTNPDSVMTPGTESFNPRRYIDEQQWVKDDFDATDVADIAALRAMDPYVR